MPVSAATSKGAATREAIVERAYGIAGRSGLEGLSIGPLASAVGMSKSGVFAHFGSREELQLAVLDTAARRFGDHVLRPALAAPRGLPRLRAIFANWLAWMRQDEDSGCLFQAAVSEYDDRPGPLRDRLLQHEMSWRNALARAAQLAVDGGELSTDTDLMQLAFELYGLALVVNHDAGLTGRVAAVERGMRGFDRLIGSHATPSAAPSNP